MHAYLLSADFFQNLPFRNIISVSNVQFRFQIRPDLMLGLIWVLTVCKGYQQITCWEIVYSFFAGSNLSFADKLCKQCGPRLGLFEEEKF